MAHIEDATTNLFNMSNLFYQELPEKIKPKLKASNSKELIFDDKGSTQGLKSKIKCMTAGGKGVGRSDTFQNLHISEYAFWPVDKKSTLAGLMQSVPYDTDTMVIIESTANGYDDFKTRWDDAVSGKSDFYPLFCAWYELDEYRKNSEGIVFTDKERELQKMYNLDDSQLAWRRWKIINDCGGDEDLFRQEYPSCPEEAFLLIGNIVFNKGDIIKRLEFVKNIKPFSRGYFTYKKRVIDLNNYEISDIEWKQDNNGYITLHKDREIIEERNVKRLKPYVIGCDISGTGIDYNAAKVVDNISKTTVATLHIQQLNEDLLADQLYCLGKYYNDALIAVETNYSILCERELEKLNYPNLYTREKYDVPGNVYTKVFGFDTNLKTRPLMIGELVKLFRQDISAECDENTLRECLSFIKNSQGRPEAENGAHDDLVIARAIANIISDQQTTSYIEKEVPKTLPFALQTLEEDEENLLYESMFY